MSPPNHLPRQNARKAGSTETTQGFPQHTDVATLLSEHSPHRGCKPHGAWHKQIPKGSVGLGRGSNWGGGGSKGDCRVFGPPRFVVAPCGRLPSTAGTLPRWFAAPRLVREDPTDPRSLSRAHARSPALCQRAASCVRGALRRLAVLTQGGRLLPAPGTLQLLLLPLPGASRRWQSWSRRPLGGGPGCHSWQRHAGINRPTAIGQREMPHPGPLPLHCNRQLLASLLLKPCGGQHPGK